MALPEKAALFGIIAMTVAACLPCMDGTGALGYWGSDAARREWSSAPVDAGAP